MKRIITAFAIGSVLANSALAQVTDPAVTSWLQNTTIYGSHYVQGNSTPIQDNVLANVQQVAYNTNWAYISTTGIPCLLYTSPSPRDA